MQKTRNTRKRLLTLLLALAMVFTSVSVPSVTAEAAKTVKVKKVQITSPKKKTTTLVKGKTLQIKVKVTPKNAKNKKVTYKSSKKKVASVTSKGKVKGLKKGTAKITVTAKDGSKKKATLTVKVVNPVKVTKVKLNKTAATVNVGKTVTLKATCTPSKATNKTVSWKSSNTKVATVTSKGVVKGVKAGTATITATAKDGSKKKATCKVTVKAASVTPAPSVKTLESIAVSTPPTKTSYYVGDKFDPAGMAVTATYSDKTTKALGQAEYTFTPSADTALKTSDKTVTVSYTEGGVTRTATTPIAVTARPTLRSIEITAQPTKTVYEEGEQFDPAGMKVVATLSNGTTEEVTDYTYPKEKLEVTVGTEFSTLTISYTANSRTVTADVQIQVKAKNPLKSISVELLKTTLPRAGGSFQKGDVEVTATFEDDTTKEISIADCTVNPSVFTTETTSATVSYWYGGIRKTSEAVTGFTVTAYREGYTFDDANSVGTLVKRADENANAVPTEDNAGSINLSESDFVDGINGKALKMDGTYGLRLDNIAGTDSESYSISMWVKPDSLKNSQALVISTSSKFGLSDGGAETWCAVAGDNQGTGSIKLWSRDTVGYVEDHKQGTISVGENAEWSHVVLVVDGTKTKAGTAPAEGAERSLGTLYINGKKVYSADIANEKVNGRGVNMKTYVGVTGWTADGYYAGLIDELVFTNEVMTNADVEKDYLEGVETSGNQISKITTVSPDDGAEIEVPYGTSLADVKDELVKVPYKAKAEGQDEVITLTTTDDMWSVEGYTVTSTGSVNATVTLQAPDGCIFNLGGKTSMSVTRTVKVNIKEPVTVSAVVPSSANVTVPYGTSEDAVKEELAKLTFTVTTSDGSDYEIQNLARKWSLTETENGYTAAFDLGTAEVGYKYAADLAVTVTVTVKQAIKITGLTVTSDTIEVAYNTPEAAVKAELAKLTIGATVADGDTAPESIDNTAGIWSIESYAAQTAGNYTAKATVAAPVGYDFADSTKAVVEVTVTVAARGGHVLNSIIVEEEPARINYIVGDDFDKTGMVVKAYYADGESEDVTEDIVITDAENLELTKKAVTISYTDGEGDAGITKTCEQLIKVVKVEDGAAAHYAFEGDLQNSVDASKSAKVVTDVSLAASTETPNYKDGLKGQGILFNDTATRTGIQLAESIASGKTDFTLNLWVNLKSEPVNWGEIVMGTNASKQKQLMLYAYPGSEANGLEAQLSDTGTQQQRFHSALIKDQWRMLTWVNNASGTKIYIDGVNCPLDEGKDLVVKNGIEKFIIGAGAWGDYFHGYIDEVSIYDSSLKETQVKALYDTVTPTISGFSVDAKEDDFTFLKSVVQGDTTSIQDALKDLEIKVAMKNGTAPEIKNDTDWTLIASATGYTATKEVAVPAGYAKTKNLNTTLTVNVIVRDTQLSSIELTRMATKKNYAMGEEFDPAGMVVTATYDDKSTKDVTKDVEITGGRMLTPDDGTEITKAQTVTISYTDGGVTKTASQEVTVINPSTVKGAMLAARTAYYQFDGTLEDSHKNNTVAKTVKTTGYDVFADTNLADSAIYSDISMSGKSLGVNKDVAVELPESISKDNKEFTINLWVQKKEGTSNWGAIFQGKNGEGYGKGIVMYAYPEAGGSAQSDKMQLQTHGGDKSKDFALANDKWTMLTFVNTDGSMEFYIDGVAQELTADEKKGLSVTAGIDTMLLGIGQWHPSYLVGNIDEVSIYNTALTAEQVTLLKSEVQQTE